MVGIMGWEAPKQSWRKGPWTPEEDKLLAEYVNFHGEGRWSSVARSAGLNRSGKSCRLRWVNYLRPGLKRGHITPQEEVIIVELHRLWGNKWSTIARYLPGRTDNEIKNYWRTRFKKKEMSSQKQQKRKAQILKLNQQQHHHQQQQQQQVEEPQHPGKDQTSAGGDDGKRKSQVTDISHQEAAAGAASYWLDQCYLIDEGFLWGGCLGSQLDHPLYQPAANCNKIIALQNQATTYSSFGGDARNVYNAAAGYIF